MKRRRWAFGMVAIAGAVTLVVPAVGQGQATRPSLQWSGTRSKATLRSYDLGAVDGGSRVSKGFRLRNAGLTRSGKLAITLTGSSTFSIALDHCTQTSLGKKWCLVSVSYTPLGAGTSDSATLRATGDHGVTASLHLSGRSAGPSGNVYWVSLYAGTVNAVPRGGGGVTTLATSPNYDAESVAVDGTNVYWVDEYGGTVNEVPLGGGTVTTLASGQEAPMSVAVDGTHVYWVNWGFGNGTVNEVPIGGGPVTTLATGQSYVCASMAVDGANVYWVNWGDGTVNDVPIGGGPVTTLATGPAAPVAVAVDGTHVYWAALGFGSVNEVPIGGGAATMLASEPGTSPDSVAVDGTHVYWATRGGTVNKVRLGGGRVITLATGQTSPGSVAVGP